MMTRAAKISAAIATSISEDRIRFSADGSVSMVWSGGEAVRVPTQQDLDRLPVGDDMTDEEVAGLDG
jgi:hypothetical protein